MNRLFRKQCQKVMAIIILWVLLLPSAQIGAKEKIPLPAHVVLFKAQQLMEKEKYTQAAHILKTFQDKGENRWRPGDPDPRGRHHHLIAFTRANCYLMADQPAKAVPQYRAAVLAKPDFSSAWMNLAKCQYDLNDYVHASHAFLKGYETDADKKPQILYYAAVCLLTSDAKTLALPLFERLSKRHPHAIKSEWKETIVQAYLSVDRPRKALPFIEELSEITSGTRQVRWQEVRLQQYLALDMKVKALKYVKWLIRQYPTEPKWWQGLAHLHLNANRYKPALTALTVKSFLAPLTAQETKLAADLNMTLDIPVLAVRLYEKILSQKMTRDGQIKIARGYIRLHQPETALKWLNQESGPKDDPKRMVLKGEILYELARYAEALSVFTAAANQKIEPGYAWLMAGYAAWAMGDVAKSRQAFKKAIKYPRQQKAAQKGLQRMF